MGKSSTKRNQKSRNPKDSGRKLKKKVSILDSERIDYVDWKDVNLLRRFISDRAKVRARRVTGNDVQQQREIAIAIKNAREMALIPYSSRVTTQRGNRNRPDRDGDDRRERRDRSESNESADVEYEGLDDVDEDIETTDAAVDTETEGDES